MSDFDFDALRDSNAPQSGARERAGVEARARQLRSRARRTRIATAVTSLIAVVAIAVGVVAITRPTDPTITVEGNASTTVPPTTTPTTYGPSTANGGFIPPTTTQDGLVVLPVTLPDGETFTMRYPPAMKIAQLGFGGGLGIGSYRATIRYTTIQHVYGGTPIATFPGANGGQVPLFHSNQRSGFIGGAGNELAFQFGHWLVIVDQPIDSGPTVHADIAARASKLTGSEDASGYLLLHAQDASVAIGDSFDGGFGAVPGNYVELAAHVYCGQVGSDTSAHRRLTNGDGSKGVSWCDGELHVSAGGTNPFLDHAATELHVSPLIPAGGNTTPLTTAPTTTTTRAAPATPAVSASFVSPDQGFVLEQNGRVDTTTDGGATWDAAGSIGKAAGDRRIRFIGPADGFAFDREGGALEITHDAGATWIDLTTPFTTVYDLAVLRGMVYVVGAPRDSTIAIGIWATPVEHLVWKRDPLSLHHGAGPVTSVQLVLAGLGGWILNVDRTVISGARLSSSGSWAAWNPPCLGKNGPAFMAASTSTDVIATCAEGIWGPPQRGDTVYVSHDGGTSSTRRDAPGFGPVTAADSTTAVVGGNGKLWRTTDAGRSWAVVAKFGNPDAIPSDLGFTTSAQGFAIVDGQMLMTHDAGATWQQVTLP